MTEYTNADGVVANEPIDEKKLAKAKKILVGLQKELKTYIDGGSGPFLAAIYDQKGKLIAKAANSVVAKQCSHNHAEMNTIREAEKLFNTYDLSPYSLSLYTTSEPCVMCMGGILWSGIKEVYYGVPSPVVEKITDFDEGFKTHWLEEFRRRGILVYGNIAPEVGAKVMQDYVDTKHIVYKPLRKAAK